MAEPATMREMIDRAGWVTQFRWWLFKRLSDLLYWICPQPHRRYMQAIWGAKMGEFKEAADRLTKPEQS